MKKVKDLDLAAYLIMNGYQYEAKPCGKIYEFVFEGEKIEEEVQKFFQNEGRFLDYTNTLRNLKARITCEQR